jgi:hypothetical protein
MAAAATIGEILALKLQELRRSQDDPRPLVRIDNRAEAAVAPFQFDAAAACLHLRGCRAIPSSSRTAVYGLWRIPPQALRYLCQVCHPQADGEREMAREGSIDYIYGLLSVLDQFGSLIRERGREYRESEEGQQLRAGLDDVYRRLEDQERATLQVVLNSLDGLLATLTDIHKSLDADSDNRNGSANSDGCGAGNDAGSTNGARTHTATAMHDTPRSE